MSTAHPPLRVLSLSGGGYLGLYTAAVLAGLEARAAEPLARRFDLIAGTSIGAALALAFEAPMSRLVSLFIAHGAEVFSGRALPASRRGRRRCWCRRLARRGPADIDSNIRAATACASDVGRSTG
jgi:patatin-like phospholipase/acyl hydrolase